MTIQAGSITQYLDVDSGTTCTNVPWRILDGETMLFEGNQSFPLTTSSEEVTDFLGRTLQVHIDDMVRYEASKAHQENLEKAATLATELSGTVIANDTVDTN